MNFLISLSADIDVDKDRLERAGDRRRRQHDVAEEFQCLGIAAVGDRAHIPDDAALRFHVSRPDQQAAALAVFGGDLPEQLRCNHFLDLLAQGAAVGQGKSSCETIDDRPERAHKNIIGFQRRINFPQLIVIFRPREREGGDQGPGAHSGYD